MIVKHVFKDCLIAALVAFGFNSSLAVGTAAQQGADTEEGVEVLTRGPVHEAFAEVVAFDPEPGIIAPNEPPEAIEELPPEQRPEGANVQWIPGYTAWDDEREDFLWVSGIWRDLPPGRQWVPGYWTESESGYQWISGYWADATVTEIRYLPEPPATVEAGPNIDAPSAEHIWLPGCWIWHENRYAWRPGYWTPMQTDWLWVPAHYVWTPRGYVFIDGYNDYSVARRGVLFAPVYLDAGIYSRQGYYWSPRTVINLGQFTAHLFSRPRYRHYYFGDYYADSYSNAGFYPWFTFASDGYGYDPFYAQQRWQHRDDRDWERSIETNFRRRRENEDERPPRTLAAQLALNEQGVVADDTSGVIAMSIEDLTQNQDSPIRFETVDEQERQEIGQRGQDVQKFRRERRKLEADAAVATANDTDPATATASEPVAIPVSPIVATPETNATNAAVPAPPEVPELDLNVEPRRKARRDAKNAAREPGDQPEQPKSKNRPGTRRGKSKDAANDDGEPGEKVDPKSDRPKTDPKSDRPKVDPEPDQPDRPKTSRKQDRPKVDPTPDQPKVDPKPDRPKVDPKPDRPKVEPKPDRPKVDTKPDRPKVDPKPDRPKVNPDRPKVDPKPDRPKVEPKPDRPKVDPKPDRPKVEPKPDRPKVDPTPDRPKVEPKPDRPKVEPKPDRPKVDPTPDRPKVEPKPKPDEPEVDE